jgi:RING finger protein 170
MLWVVTVPFGVKHDAVSLYWMQMILSAVYIISPIDIIPEGVLGVVGLLDDLLIALICFLHVAALYRSVLYFRHAGS